MTGPAVLVACVGNVLLGDDGFGVAVGERLRARAWPSWVHIREFGIRGIDFAYALLDGYATAILVDATPRGGPPGRLYVLEPGVPAGSRHGAAALDPHRSDPGRVLEFVRAMGADVARLRVVGCEPGHIADDEDLHLGLSEAVRDAVEPAVDLVVRLVEETMAAGGASLHA